MWPDAQEPVGGRVVVYLEAQSERPDAGAQASRAAIDLWSTDRARPQIVAVGQSVRFRNRDPIYHRVFSTSAPNDFELEPLPAGSAASHRFTRPGVVRIYCALHEQESAVVFVAPTPHYGLADAAGRFVLRDVSPGRYRLRAWGEGLASAPLELVVAPGDAKQVELRVTASGRADLRLAREGQGP